MLYILLLANVFAASTAKSLVDEYFEALDKYIPEENARLMGASSAEYKKKQLDRFKSFRKSKLEIDRINMDDSVPFEATVNEFSLMSEAQKQQHFGLNISMMSVKGEESHFAGAPMLGSGGLPSYVDWIDRGANPAIKNQGSCASCWAFAGVSSMEAAHFQVTGKLQSFSEQEILDCSYEQSYGKDGCKGGWLDASLSYVKAARRLASGRSAKYQGRDGYCNYRAKPNAMTNAYVSNYVVLKGDTSLMSGVNRGIVAVAIFTSNAFQVYSKGIFKDPRGCAWQKVNHAVAVVGYGKQGNNPYWTVRNSWGDKWGDNGYVRMCRLVNNNCFISDHGYLPVLRCNGSKCKSPRFPKQKQPLVGGAGGMYCSDRSGYCKKKKSSCGKNSRIGAMMRKICPFTCKVGSCGQEKRMDKSGCPAGTTRCADGSCKHEHMC